MPNPYESKVAITNSSPLALNSAYKESSNKVLKSHRRSFNRNNVTTLSGDGGCSSIETLNKPTAVITPFDAPLLSDSVDVDTAPEVRVLKSKVSTDNMMAAMAPIVENI